MRNIVILAAGMGVRLGDQTREMPKSGVMIQEKPLCHYVVKNLLDYFPHDHLFVVGGYAFPVLKELLEPFSSKIQFIENRDYRDGNLLTLFKVQPFVRGDMVIMNMDHVYSPKILKKMDEGFQKQEKRIWAACDFDRSLMADDMKVKINETGNAFSFLKNMDSFDAGYVGVTAVRESVLDFYWQTAEKVLLENGRRSCVEEILNAMAKLLEPIGVVDISGSQWLEVDTEEDRLNAEKKITEVMKRTS